MDGTRRCRCRATHFYCINIYIFLSNFIVISNALRVLRRTWFSLLFLIRIERRDDRVLRQKRTKSNHLLNDSMRSECDTNQWANIEIGLAATIFFFYFQSTSSALCDQCHLDCEFIRQTRIDFARLHCTRLWALWRYIAYSRSVGCRFYSHILTWTFAMNPIDHLCNRSLDEDILRVALIVHTKYIQCSTTPRIRHRRCNQILYDEFFVCRWVRNQMWSHETADDVANTFRIASWISDENLEGKQKPHLSTCYLLLYFRLWFLLNILFLHWILLLLLGTFSVARCTRWKHTNRPFAWWARFRLLARSK